MDLDFKRLRYAVIPKPLATHQPCSEFLLNLDLSLQETLGSMLLPALVLIRGLLLFYIKFDA